MKKIVIKINGKNIECQEGETVMEVALKNNIYIPGLCYCADLIPQSSCRLCLIEVKGKKGLQTSCNTKAKEKMEIITDSEEIKKVRKTNLELILSQHAKNCLECRRVKHCKIIKVSRYCGVDISDFSQKDNVETFPEYHFGPAITFDTKKCINCYNCIEVCKNQGVGFLELKRKDGLTRILPCKGKECVYCGQCLVHCPGGAFREQSSIADIINKLKDKDNAVIFQFSSTMVKSLGKELDFDFYRYSISPLCRALKSIGARMVFDTSFGVDIVMEKEVGRLIDNIKKGKCIFTSHCPSFVKYIESYYPEFIPNLSRIKSPHIVWGGAVKDYLIKEKGISREKITIVSIAPCTSKKYEVQKKDLELDGNRPVDYSITMNELYQLLKKNGVNIQDHIDAEDDKDIYIKNEDSYDSNEDIIKLGIRFLSETFAKEKAIELKFDNILGIKDAIETSFVLDDTAIKVAIVYGLGNAKKILEILKKDPTAYDYIEVMACPNGCLGGGGRAPSSDYEKVELKPVSNEYKTSKTYQLVEEIKTRIKRNKEIFE